MTSSNINSKSNGKAAVVPPELNQAFFKVAFDLAVDAITIKDSQLRYIYVNPAFLRIWNEEASVFLGRTNAEIFYEHDFVADEFDRRVLEGKVVENDVLWPHKSEKHYYHTIRTPIQDAAGAISGICLIARDVTDHLEAQKALRESEERFRAVVESTSDCIWIKNQSLRFTHVNPAFMKLWGAASPAAFIGKTREEAFAEKNEHVDELERRVLEGDAVEEDVFFPTSFWDFHFHDTRLPLKNDKGDIIGLCGIRRDLTDHIRAEETNRRASRYEAAMATARGIAHDFGNLMTIILGNIGLLRMQNDEQSDVQVQLDAIYRTAQRAKDMAQQMLSLSRGGEIADLKPVNVQTIIDEMISIYGHAVPKDLNLETNMNADLWDIIGDASQINRMLMNLGINAVEAMQRKGTLRVMTDNVSADRMLAEKYPGLTAGQDYVQLTFEDTGCGMDKETMEKLFEPFFSTKKEGRGLGLSAVYAITKNHNGHIFCRSQVNRGATFDVFLPAFKAAGNAIRPDIAALPKGNEAILIVDGDNLVAATAKKILQELGYAALHAPSGRAALEILNLPENSVDLVLLDLDTPNMEEGSIYSQMRELQPQTKIMVCSAYSQDMLSRSFPRGRINGFVHKPFRTDVLATMIRRVLDGTLPQKPKSYAPASGFIAAMPGSERGAAPEGAGSAELR